MSAVDRGAAVLRRGVVVTDAAHLAVVQVEGSGAAATLDRLLPCELHLYDGGARPTLLVDPDDGRVIADVTVVRAAGGTLLLADGLGAAELADRIRDAAPPGATVEVRDVRDDRVPLTLHGPFAWELAAAWLGRHVIGLPSLALYTAGRAWILRYGRTGEIGYEVLVPRGAHDEEIDRLRALGERFDLLAAPQESVDRCTLEVGGFVARRPALAALSPVELQLQWRVSARKDHVGRAALDRRRAAATRRITWFHAATPIAEGLPVALDGLHLGDVLGCEPLSSGRGWGGIALLDRRWAHAGLALETPSGPITTASAPLIEPTSRRVRVHSDTYASWHEGSHAAAPAA